MAWILARFGDPTVPDTARADIDPLRGPVYEYFHPLYIRHPAPVSNARHVLAYPAFTFGFAPPHHDIASAGFFPANLAHT